MVPAVLHVHGAAGGFDDDDVFDGWAGFESFVDIDLEGDFAVASTTSVGGDEGDGITILEEKL
jgi:hypothetical protein